MLLKLTTKLSLLFQKAISSKIGRLLEYISQGKEMSSARIANFL